MILENKIIGGKIISHKQIDRNGVPVGIIEGYIATWDIDRDKDRFVKGAFSKSVDRHRKSGRQIRLKDLHGRTVGGWPIDTVREDDKGLFGIGEINLETQQGREMYSLVRQGVLTDLSIGYSVNDSEYKDNIRHIKESEVWEGSVVDEPANPNAVITAVKNINGNLPKCFVPMSYKWEPDTARARVDGNESAYLYNVNGELKMQIADMVRGELKVIPRAVISARVEMSIENNDFSAEEKLKIKSIINSLYKDLRMDQPFTGDAVKPFCIKEIMNMSKSTLTNVIRYCELSKDAASYVSSHILPSIMGDNEKADEIVDGMKSLLVDMQNIKKQFRRN